MKIVKKPTVGTLKCPLCNCEFIIKGRDWRKVTSYTNAYRILCPNCKYPVKFIPGEIKCKM